MKSTTAGAVTSCDLSNMVCHRFRDCLGSECIVVYRAGRAEYSHSDLKSEVSFTSSCISLGRLSSLRMVPSDSIGGLMGFERDSIACTIRPRRTPLNRSGEDWFKHASVLTRGQAGTSLEQTPEKRSIFKSVFDHQTGRLARTASPRSGDGLRTG